MFTLLKVVGERARSPTTFVMITNQKCQLYHYFHKWLAGRSEWVFINGFQFCQKSAALIAPSSLVFFTSEIELLTSLYFHAILGSVNTGVNTEDIF